MDAETLSKPPASSGTPERVISSSPNSAKPLPTPSVAPAALDATLEDVSSDEEVSKVLNQVSPEPSSNDDDNFFFSFPPRRPTTALQRRPQTPEAVDRRPQTPVNPLPSKKDNKIDSAVDEPNGKDEEEEDDVVDVTPTVPEYRAVTNYKYSYDKNGKKNSRLIVPESTNEKLVRIYAKSFERCFFCLACIQINPSKRIKANFNGDTFMAPVLHECTPISLDQALAEAQTNKKKATDAEKDASKELSSDEYNDDNDNGNGDEENAVETKKPSTPPRDPNQKTHDQYEFHAGGTSNDKRGKIVVYEDDNHKLVREYRKDSGNHYYCIECKRTSNIRVRGVLKNETFFTPPIGLHSCQPKTYQAFEIEQNEYESRQNASLQSSSLVGRRPKRGCRPLVNLESATPTKFARIEYNLHDPDSRDFDSANVESKVERSSRARLQKKPLAARKTSPIATAAAGEDNSGAKDDVKDEKLKIKADPDLSRRANLHTTIRFYRLAEYQHAQICKKLNLRCSDHPRDFWNKVNIKKIYPSSYPSKIHPTAENEYHGFSCLSLYLTGSEDQASAIQAAVNKHLYHNFEFLGHCLGHDFAQISYKSPIISDAIWSKTTQEVHYEMLCRWLECRIGVYGDGTWARYGNWDIEDSDIPVFLLESTKGGHFNPVLELKD